MTIKNKFFSKLFVIVVFFTVFTSITSADVDISTKVHSNEFGTKTSREVGVEVLEISPYDELDWFQYWKKEEDNDWNGGRIETINSLGSYYTLLDDLNASETYETEAVVYNTSSGDEVASGGVESFTTEEINFTLEDPQVGVEKIGFPAEINNTDGYDSYEAYFEYVLDNGTVQTYQESDWTNITDDIESFLFDVHEEETITEGTSVDVRLVMEADTGKVHKSEWRNETTIDPVIKDVNDTIQDDTYTENERAIIYKGIATRHTFNETESGKVNNNYYSDNLVTLEYDGGDYSMTKELPSTESLELSILEPMQDSVTPSYERITPGETYDFRYKYRYGDWEEHYYSENFTVTIPDFKVVTGNASKESEDPYNVSVYWEEDNVVENGNVQIYGTYYKHLYYKKSTEDEDQYTTSKDSTNIERGIDLTEEDDGIKLGTEYNYVYYADPIATGIEPGTDEYGSSYSSYEIEEPMGDVKNFQHFSDPEVVTYSAENVNQTHAFVSASVNSLGEYDSVDAYIYWQENSDTGYVKEFKTSLSSPANITHQFNGLKSNTTYNYYGHTESDGNTVADGETLSFTTTEYPEPNIDTLSAVDVDSDSGRMRANITNLGKYSSLDTYIEWQEEGDAGFNKQYIDDIDSEQVVSYKEENLSSDTQYNFRGVMINDTGHRVSEGDTLSFNTNLEPPNAYIEKVEHILHNSTEVTGCVDSFGDYTSPEYQYVWQETGSDTYNETEWKKFDGENTYYPYNITGLNSGTEYEVEFRYRYDNTTESGGTEIFTTTSDPEVVTYPAENVNQTHAFVSASVNSLGGYDSVDAYINWFEEGESEITEEFKTSLSSPANITHQFTELKSNTTYNYYGYIENNGNAIKDGEILSFTTTAEEPTYSIGDAEEITNDSAVVKGCIGGKGDYSRPKHRFVVWEDDTDDFHYTDWVNDTSENTCFEEEVTGLNPATLYNYEIQYEFDETTKASDTEQFETTTTPKVVTEDATSIGLRSGTIYATAEELGWYSRLEAWLLWREKGDSKWNSEYTTTVSEKNTSFLYVLDDLDLETTYEYKGVLYTDDSDTASEGGIKEFTTVFNHPNVTTKDLEKDHIGKNLAYLQGNISYGDAENPVVYFDYRDKNSSEWKTTDKTELDGDTEFEEKIGLLKENTTYEYRANVDYTVNDNETRTGEIKEFTTVSKPLFETKLVDNYPSDGQGLLKFQMENNGMKTTVDSELLDNCTVTLTGYDSVNDSKETVYTENFTGRCDNISTVETNMSLYYMYNREKGDYSVKYNLSKEDGEELYVYNADFRYGNWVDVLAGSFGVGFENFRILLAISSTVLVAGIMFIIKKNGVVSATSSIVTLVMFLYLGWLPDIAGIAIIFVLALTTAIAFMKQSEGV